MKPISLAEYARHRDVTRAAVSKAVKQGRLSSCVVQFNGRPRITSREDADAEWSSTTLARATDLDPPVPVQVQAAQIQAAEPPRYKLGDESAREKHWKANLAELEFRKKSGALISATEARDVVIDRFTEVRTKLLGLPVRIRQRLPALTPADVLVIDDLVREALEALVSGD